MKRRIVIVALVVLAAVAAVFTGYRLLNPPDPFLRKVSEVKEGMLESEVLAIMGQPQSKTPTVIPKEHPKPEMQRLISKYGVGNHVDHWYYSDMDGFRRATVSFLFVPAPTNEERRKVWRVAETKLSVTELNLNKQIWRERLQRILPTWLRW